VLLLLLLRHGACKRRLTLTLPLPQLLLSALPLILHLLLLPLLRPRLGLQTHKLPLLLPRARMRRLRRLPSLHGGVRLRVCLHSSGSGSGSGLRPSQMRRRRPRAVSRIRSSSFGAVRHRVAVAAANARTRADGRRRRHGRGGRAARESEAVAVLMRVRMRMRVHWHVMHVRVRVPVCVCMECSQPSRMRVSQRHMILCPGGRNAQSWAHGSSNSSDGGIGCV
jgi:hypothetical protein